MEAANVKPNELLAELRRLVDKPLDTVPPGYQCAAEFEQSWKLSRVRTEVLLKRGVKGGLLQYKELRVMRGDRPRVVRYYIAAKKPRG